MRCVRMDLREWEVPKDKSQPGGELALERVNAVA
jgi:hypothetical protein